MASVFEVAQLKLRRADAHLAALEAGIAEYVDRSPFKLVLNVQPSDKRVVLVEFHVVEQPDIYLGTVVGDCVHNLRSSLDAAIHELAETHGEEAKRTQFPILNNKGAAPLQ